MNSYFATVEQQANPRLRGKPVGVTGGDRMERTVLGAASIEAKKLGVKTGMGLWEAKKICPNIIIVAGDSSKYGAVTSKLLNIFKDYSPNLEVFSIDEVFLEIESSRQSLDSRLSTLVTLAQDIKQRIRFEVGEWMRCSVGISYNKLMAKLAGSLQKPDGLVIIPNQEAAIKVLDQVELDEICGIGGRIKKRLFNMGIVDFRSLRKVPKECLLASFKSYGEILYNMARGIDHSSIIPFYEKEGVKSVGHRHTLNKNTKDLREIKQILLKLCEMVAVRLRKKQLVGKTIHLGYRVSDMSGNGMQDTLNYHTDNGWEIFQAAWQIFNYIWDGQDIRMIGISVSNLKPSLPENLSLLPEDQKTKVILKALDKVNHKFGEFTLQRAVLLGSKEMSRKPNSFFSDRRFKLK